MSTLAQLRPALLILLLAGSNGITADDPQRLIYLLPEGFSGWVCVDFGVAGAPPLPREGNALLIRPRPGETLKTSNKTGDIPPIRDAWIESRGQRQHLPTDVYERRRSSLTDTKDPVEHHCVFFGTEDAADAAGDAPGLHKPPREARGVSTEERQALIALYEATNGARWKHRVGWLGPAGTECSWHGVRCDIRFAETTVVTSLDLAENNIVGTVPRALEELTHLEWLNLFDNHLTGKLPDAVTRRWLDGSLEVSCAASLLTDVSEVEFESAATSLLCAQHRIVLRADERAAMYTERCRQAKPDDRTTFCEVKRGRIPSEEFARLGLLLEKSGFFSLRPEYSRTVTDSTQQTTRVTRAGKLSLVTNYATAGPMELWSVQRAIEGAAASVEWESITNQRECPRQKEVQ
jgi:hypothetical protein